MGLITKSSPINFGSTNKMMPYILQMFSQKHMIDLRNKNMQDLLEKRMSGYRGLETQRHESTLVEIEARHEKDKAYLHEKLMGDLSGDATIDRLAGMIHLKEMKGEDATVDKERLAKAAGTMGSMIAKEANLETIDAKEATELAMVASEDFLRQYGTQMATTGRQEERLTREIEPAQATARGRLTLDEEREERIAGEGGEAGGLDYNKLSKLKDGLVKEKAMILKAISEGEYTTDAEVLVGLKADLARVEGEIKTVFDEIKKQSGVFGGAPTSAFSIYKQRLITNGVPEAEADRMARERYPQ